MGTKNILYDDGTVVLRIIRRNVASWDQICLIEKFFLRIIHLDGTVDEKDIDLGIQPFNYCIQKANGLNFKYFVDFINYALIRKNQVLVTYYNATDLNDFHTYEEWGMIIDFDGNVKSRISFGFTFIEQRLQQLVSSNSEIMLNINREKGFFRIASIRNTTDIEWQQYKAEPDGTITRLTNGILPFKDFSSSLATVIATVDEGYAVIYVNKTTTPLSLLSVLHIGYNQTPVEPFSIYQASALNLTIISVSCNIVTVGVGHICTLTVNLKDPAGLQPDEISYVKINFLSSGLPLSSKVINRLFPIIENTNLLGLDWQVNDLPFGGYLLTNSSAPTTNGTIIYGYLFDEDDSNYLAWALDEPQQS